jgi:hypothetical protein
MECKYCKKFCKNDNSLQNHQRLCKLNPNKQTIKSNFILYNEKVKTGGVIKNNKNQHVKAKLEGRKVIVNDETRKKISKSNKGKKWNEEKKYKHKEIMKNVVLKNPESYSASNVSGRTPTIEYNGFKLKGSWELEVAKWLDRNNIEWTNKIKPFEYKWENSTHLYFPDFYLIKYDKYIEVKGFERARDKCKWDVVKDLIIIKKDEIKKIKNDTCKLLHNIKEHHQLSI